MNKLTIMLPFVGLTAVSVFGYTSNEIDWRSNAADGNLASAANWSNVPEGVTDIGYDLTSDKGYWGKFSIGSANLKLYLNGPFTFDRFYFQGSNSKYDIDLGGNTLTLRGAATYEFTTHASYKPQKIMLRNGNIAFSKSTRRQFNIQGEGNVMTVAGTEESPVTFSGGEFTPMVTSSGELIFSNAVFASGAKVKIGAGKVSFLGERTAFEHSTGDYFGVGDSTSSGVLVIAGGAKVLANNTQMGYKNSITVGGTGNYNALIVAGAGTVLSNSNRTAKSGDASVAIGKASTGNFLHVTDGAELNLTAHIVLGNTQEGTDGGSSSGNRLRIDTNAVVYASGLRIGQRSSRGTGDELFVSNVCEVANNAKVYIEDRAEHRDESIRLAAQRGIDYCALSISENAQVVAKYAQIGLYGVSNRMDVVSGGAFVSASSAVSEAGLAVGGVNSSGTVLNVDGGVLGLTNTLFRMDGAAADASTLVRLANGADACARFCFVTNAGNRLEIDDAKLLLRTRGRFPESDVSTVDLAFSGAHPLLSCKKEDATQANPAIFGFYPGASLSFVIPAGGYAEAPIMSTDGITVSGLSSVSIDVTAFRSGGGEAQVLMDAGNGTISIDEDSLKLFRTAAGDCYTVKIADHGRRLVLTERKGLVLLFR